MSGHDLVFSYNWKSLAHKTRQARRSTVTISNRLCSILDDAEWLYHGVILRYPSLPLFANMRTGSWYFPPRSYCYFKSTDGHYGCWAFSLTRLNLELAKTGFQHGGAIVVDATKKGKEVPDALSKTLPLWCYIINSLLFPGDECPSLRDLVSPGVPDTEVSAMHSLAQETLRTLPETTRQLIQNTLSSTKTRPFRTQFHVQPSSRGQIPSPAWDIERFDPLLRHTTSPPSIPPSSPVLHLVSVSRVVPDEGDVRSLTTGWTYMEGAGDDVEHWADPIPLTPGTFWDREVLQRFLHAVQVGSGDQEVTLALRGGGVPDKTGVYGAEDTKISKSYREWFEWLSAYEGRIEEYLEGCSDNGTTVDGDDNDGDDGDDGDGRTTQDRESRRAEWLSILEVICAVLWCLDVPAALRDRILHRSHGYLSRLHLIEDDEEGNTEQFQEEGHGSDLDLTECFFRSSPDEAFADPFSMDESLYSYLFHPNRFMLPSRIIAQLFPLSAIHQPATPATTTSSVAFAHMQTPTHPHLTTSSFPPLVPNPLPPPPSSPIPWNLLVLVHPANDAAPPVTHTHVSDHHSDPRAPVPQRTDSPVIVLHLRVPTDKKSHAKALGVWDKQIFPALARAIDQAMINSSQVSDALGSTSTSVPVPSDQQSPYRIAITPMGTETKEAAVVIATVAHFHCHYNHPSSSPTSDLEKAFANQCTTGAFVEEGAPTESTSTWNLTKSDIRSVVSHFQAELKVPNISREWLKQVNRYMFSRAMTTRV